MLRYLTLPCISLSGTNDKAGSGGYVARWVSPQSIKETTVPLDDWRYSHMTN